MATARVDIYLHGDPGVLPAGTSANQVAGIVQRAVDASGLLRNLAAAARNR